MNHFWQSIEGHFTFQDLYTWLAKEVPSNGHIVEVGSYRGQSAAFLAVELKNLGKDQCRIDLVDLFQGTPDVPDVSSPLVDNLPEVKNSLTPVSDIIDTYHKETSWEAAQHYADASLDAVFIDADHSYEATSKDINAWLPKLKPGAIIAGHDLQCYGVIRAVTESFKSWTTWQGMPEKCAPSWQTRREVAYTTKPIIAIPHFWQSIQGFFTFPDFYSWLARQLPQNGRVVEVGAYTGQSAAYLATELHNLGSSCKLDLVDLYYAGSLDKVRTSLAPVKHIVDAYHQGYSWDEASHYEDESLDAVFLDADHAYESIRKDIDAWLPKVKIGGIICGHDFTPHFEGVIRAVTETFDKWEVWRGISNGGDAGMQGKFWPVWCTRKTSAVPRAKAAATKDPSAIYDERFFDQYMQIGPTDYEAIAKVIHENLTFDSVLDVGCGPGLILNHLHSHGYTALGIEGSSAAIQKAPNTIASQIMQADLTTWQAPGPATDLVICSEVAEHLDAEHADKLVETITTLAKDVVFLTAAIPGQGGHDHVNEQPNSYWIKKMRMRGFRFNAWKTDTVRAALSRSVKTLHWFSNNAMIFERCKQGANPEPTVSVVIPCFNQAKFLTEAIQSILTQTHPPDQIVIVTGDDLSEQVAKTTDLGSIHATVIRDPGHGLAHARNLGIKAATSSYIVPLDADDKLEPKFIEKTLAAAKDAGPFVIVSPDLKEFEAGKAEFHPDEDKLARGYTPQCCLFSKALWQAVKDANGEGYDSGSPVEDWAFWLDCHAQGASLRHVPETVFRYRRHACQLTNTDPRPAFLAATRWLRPHTFPATLQDDITLVRSPELQAWAHKRLAWFPTNQSLQKLLATAANPASPAAGPSGWDPREQPTKPDGVAPVVSEAVQAHYGKVIADTLRELRATERVQPIEAPAPAKPGQSKICLCMIVKNESPVIERCLRSVQASIDAWCIVDTGSTDGTQARIKTLLSSFPGTLHERPWKNFEHNRNEALLLAEQTAKETGAEYLLIIDADDVMVGAVHRDLDKDVYDFTIQYNNFEYKRVQVFRIGKGLKYIDPVHEYLHCPPGITRSDMEGASMRIVGGGARSQDPKKFLKDAQMLEEAVKRKPDDGRPQFYLAQSYKDAGENEKAIDAYKKRSEMGGVVEEVFISLLEIAKLFEAQKRQPRIIVEAYLRAWEHRPSRAEPLYYLGRYLRIGNGVQPHTPRHALAAALLREAAILPKSRDWLFVDTEIYAWRAKDEYAVNLFWIGRHEEAAQISTALLDDPALPASMREHVKSNLNHSLRALGKPAR
jgi:glycosyltransferase involved in cell wall biosynthesis/predicted O-methyltransferase YrrM